MLRLGLTGGIGSGKSTVAATLAACGASLVDADAIARAATAPGGAAMPAIAAAFGEHFITSDGALDRVRMRAEVFSDPDARQRLEAIVHPEVRRVTEAQVDAARKRGARCVVFDVPLLVESGAWAGRLDRVLVVDCTVETQLARVALRDALPRATTLSIVAAQAPRAKRLQAADAVVFNEGLGLVQLDAEVRRIAQCFGL